MPGKLLQHIAVSYILFKKIILFLRRLKIRMVKSHILHLLLVFIAGKCKRSFICNLQKLNNSLKKLFLAKLKPRALLF